MLAEKTATVGNSEHYTQLQKERQSFVFGSIAVSLIVASILGIAVWQFSIPAILLTVTNTTGLYFSWLIIQKELGISNSIGEKICSLTSHSHCEAVLFSKGGRINKWLSWGDIGVIFFTASLSYITLGLLSGNLSMQSYYLFSVAALIFPFYSLYYQWKVVKQLCMLCIAVLVVIGLNAIVSMSFLSTASSAGNLLFSFVAFLIVSVITGCSWQITKSLVEKNVQSFTNKISFTRLKRNPAVFKGLLNKEEVNPGNLSRHDEAISFGLPDAPIQILMACSPYCGPCAIAHQVVEKLYEKHPSKLSVSVRFALNSLEETDSRAKAAIAILKSIKEANSAPDLILKDWYSSMNYEKFVKKYNPNGFMVIDILKQHKNWSEEFKITGTPTFFINGRKLPGEYNWKEFIEVIQFELQD